MKEVLKNLAGLIKVKTFITIAVIAVFVVLALRGDISSDNAMIIISMVVSFYFGTQHEKGTGTATGSYIAYDQPTAVADGNADIPMQDAHPEAVQGEIKPPDGEVKNAIGFDR